MADLWERLRAAKAKAKIGAPADEAGPEESSPACETAPPGWSWVTPLVAEHRLVFPVEPQFWSVVGAPMDPAEWDQVLSFDTETTGLSGGAGTVAFLVGWARLLPFSDPQRVPEVEVRQWFLRDHPGEPDLIQALDAAFAEARTLVSFNGASFDLPLLRSRWSLAGRSFPEKPHRDDLHPSRRLWKRLLDSCKLSRIEETVLGIRRQDDIPGAMVPALWFDYLRQGASADFLTPLEGVLRHHAQDVYSLLCLDLLLQAMKNNPSDVRWDPTFDRYPPRQLLLRPAPEGLLHPNLGKTTPVDFWGLLRLKDDPAVEESLEDAWNEGDDEAIGMAWAARLKRQKDRRAVAIWTRLWETRKSYQALEELLKWLEHKEKSPEARAEALARIEEALKAPFLPRSWQEDLEKRRNRLGRWPT